MADPGINGNRQDFRVVGVKNVPGRLSYSVAAGVAKYGVDYVVPGMLHAKFLRSPYANAKVISINDEKARALPGFAGIVTWEDEDVRALKPCCYDFAQTRPWLDEYADRAGTEVAAIVVAEDEETCDEALRLLEVEWEIYPHCVNLREGRQPDAPVIRPRENRQPSFYGNPSADGQPPKRGNTYTVITNQGDVENGFSDADYTIEYDLRLPPFSARSPNRLASVAWWSTDPYHVEEPDLNIEGAVRWREAISTCYSVPLEKVKQEGLFLGGKYCDWGLRRSQEVTPMLAKKFGRPVKCEDRREHMFDFIMNERQIHVKVGFTKEGMITAVEDNSLADGASRGSSPFGNIGDFPQGPYNTIKCRNVRQKMEIVDSNRGVMYLSGQHCPFNWDTITTAIHLIAEKLSKDPIEITRLNLHGPDSKDDYNPVPSFEACVEAGTKMMNWTWHGTGEKRLEDGRMHGASFRYQMTPRHSFRWHHARLEYRNGRVHMPTQGPHFGTYGVEVNAMIVAEELGLEYEDVIIDYDYTQPHRAYGGGSDGTVGPGWIVKECCHILKRRIFEAAIDYAENPTEVEGGFHGFGQNFPEAGPFKGLTPDELDLVGGRIVLKSDPTQGVPFEKATTANIFATLSGRPPIGVWVSGNMGEKFDLMNTVYCEVAVDTETGEVEVLRFGVASDVGKVLRWSSVESQVDQGMYFSHGCQMYEDFFFDERTGVQLNNNLIEYKIPGMLDVPPVNTKMLETRAGNGVYGANGVSHCLANTNMIPIAIYNATGVWVEPPATPDKVLKALGKI